MDDEPMNLPSYALNRNQGQATWFLGALIIQKANGVQTGGRFSLTEQWSPAGFETPYHVHRLEDEAFYVLEGDMVFVCDGKQTSVGAGGYFFGPRDVPHGFRVVGARSSRLLVLATPPGYEQFVVEVGEPAQQLILPPPQPPDFPKLVALAAKYHMEILGPLPPSSS
jgi:quercetin dioxygenase-like cupin family protein